MARKLKSTKITLPVIVEKDEDGFYVVECPLLKGCYTQGETLDEALKNIREVIEMCLEDESEDEISDIANIQEFSFHTVAVEA
ncbi:MAG: type II toxin-antitoxin system HicB family antitoxin [Candidatus Methanoperedens sp.]|jgi:predicted RNase H-like HicB family nuclease|nr:type II toxin-antitoxin system HicB family antitoxin [Candidatus Methanoperedens sp.]